MLDGIIFDKDGTLFDFRRSWGRWTADLLRALASSEDVAIALGERIGYDILTDNFAPGSPVISATPTEIAACMLPLLPGVTLPGLLDQMNALSAATEMSPAVPLRPLLVQLRARGLRLGLATNDTEAPARAHLAAAGVIDLFDFISGCDSGYGGKPEPGQLLAFAAAFGLDAARVAMVGDSQHDLVAGRAAGMIAVAVLTGVAEASDLAPFADTVLDDISALPEWMDRLSPV
jgi:phosphoglycolate phosphatase